MFFYDSVMVGFVLYFVYGHRPGDLAGLGEFLATMGYSGLGSILIGGGWPADNIGRTGHLRWTTFAQLCSTEHSPERHGRIIGRFDPSARFCRFSPGGKRR